MRMNLSMKKILLVGLDYHHYTAEIVRELRTQGHEVHFHSIQPGLPWLKVLRKFFPRHYQPALDRYHARCITTEKDWSADLVIFIQVHQMSHANMERLRRDHARAEFVLYNWDAVSNHDYRPYLEYFERVYTFDPKDASQLGLRYLPLFCIKAFQGLPRRDPSGQSVYTVGNIVNPRRYEAIKAFERYCREHRVGFRSYLVASTHAWVMLLRQGHLPLDVTLRAIPQDDFIEMVETSTAVFDFANHQQVGYTMRLIENLCAGRKIITNNPAVRAESFYSEDRFHIFDGLDFSGVKEFLERPLREPENYFPEFHMSQFVARLVADPAPMPQASPAAHCSAST